MICKRTYKNQITLPKKVMEKFEDVEYFEVKAGEGKIVLEPVKMTALRDTTLGKARKNIAALGLTLKDVEDAIEWARKK
jgi:hypothetical protein